MGEHIQQGLPPRRATRLNDLSETEIGDWTMPNFRAACAYAASQGSLIVRDDAATLTSAGIGVTEPRMVTMYAHMIQYRAPHAIVP